MPYCETCGAKNPPDQDELLEEYAGEYFCGDECRNKKRDGEDYNVENY
jgi:hypothetical protein